MSIPNTPVVNAGLSYVNGLNLIYQGGGSIVATAKLVNMEPGQARDSTNTNDIILPEALDANGDPIEDQYGNPVGAMINGAAIGANGCDLSAFSLTNLGGWAVYVIGSSGSNQPSAGLFSQNQEVPILPAGYDMYRRVGYIRVLNVGGIPVIAQWYQEGQGEVRTYYYDLPVAQTVPLVSGALPVVYTPWNLFAPPYADQLIVDVSFTPTASTDRVSFLPFGSPAAAANPGTARGCVVFGGGGISFASESTFLIPVTPELNLSGFLDPTVLVKVSATTNALVVYVTGFVDLLE
jgi:hypothetical protein